MVSASFPTPTLPLEFWFCNKNSTPINFACKLSFVKKFEAKKNFVFPVEENFAVKSRLCKAGEENSIHYLFHNWLFSSPWNKLNFTCAHTYNATSYPLKAQCLVPTSCWAPAVWQKPWGEKRTWINSLFITNLHNKKSLFLPDNDWRVTKKGKKRKWLGNWRVIGRAGILFKKFKLKVFEFLKNFQFKFFSSFCVVTRASLRMNF